MNYEETRQILTILKVNYPQSFKDYNKETGTAFLNLWAEAFASTPVEVVARAVKSIIYTDTREFAPNIAQVKWKIGEMYGGDALDANSAWQRVLEAARKVVPGDTETERMLWEALPPIAKQIYDPADLATIGMRTSAENDRYERPRFIKAYETSRQADIRKRIDNDATGTSAALGNAQMAKMIEQIVEGKRTDGETDA